MYHADTQQGTLRTASRVIDTTRIHSVWVRRPSPYLGLSGAERQDRRFAAEQALWGTGCIIASLPEAHYMNHPWRNRAAESKPTQL